MKSVLPLALMLMSLLAVTIPAQAPPLPYEGFVVCIDPGHQGAGNSSQEPVGPGSTTTKPCVSSGTTGITAGDEHEVNLDVGLRLRDLLTAEGVSVAMTRTVDEVDLCNSQRAFIANQAGAHLFVRIHCDAGSGDDCFTLHPANIEGWTDDIYDESLRAAQIVQAAYASETQIADAGLRPRSDISGFNWSDVPVILPEMYHMKNVALDALVATPDFRQTMAQGLANGILQYLDTLEINTAGFTVQ